MKIQKLFGKQETPIKTALLDSLRGKPLPVPASLGTQMGKEGGKIDENKVRIEFIDTGTGIPAENLKKVFDPFFTTKPVGKGTGLGMSISYRVIHDHQGTIDVESEVGKGTKFIITLPINHEEKKEELITTNNDNNDGADEV